MLDLTKIDTSETIDPKQNMRLSNHRRMLNKIDKSNQMMYS